MSSFEFDMDFTGDDIDRDGKGGMVAEGGCHLQCMGIVPRTENSGDMDVEFEVLAHVKPTEVGKTHHEYFRYPDPTLSDDANGVRKSQMRQLFYALKLTTPEELKANPRFKIDLSLAVGRTCCGKIKHDHYTSKSGEAKTKATLFTKGNWDLWAVDSPKAAGIPLAGGGQGGGAGGGAGQGGSDDPFAGVV